MSAQRASQLVEAGVWLRLSGDHAGARRLFEQALKLDPSNDRARQLLASDPLQAPAGKPVGPGANGSGGFTPPQQPGFPQNGSGGFTPPQQPGFPQNGSGPFTPPQQPGLSQNGAGGFTPPQQQGVAQRSTAPQEHAAGQSGSLSQQQGPGQSGPPSYQQGAGQSRSPSQQQGAGQSGSPSQQQGIGQTGAPPPQQGFGADPFALPPMPPMPSLDPLPSIAPLAPAPQVTQAARPAAPAAYEAPSDDGWTLETDWGNGATAEGTLAGPKSLTDDATSAWDSQSNPGYKLPNYGAGDAMDMIANDPLPPLTPKKPEPLYGASKRKVEEAQEPDEVETLLNGAKDLIDLDDHSGAMDLILKAAELAPNDSRVKKMREKSETTLQSMFESKIGRMDAVPSVVLKNDEIIWLNLDHRAGFVLAQIDGSVSFEDLFEVSGMSRLDTARILAQLVEEGVIRA
ncbi:MAG: hypothetical protein ACJ790_19535 [Myxococcaceae bacterium]